MTIPKPGDKVICINTGPYGIPRVKEGEEYTVNHCTEFGYVWLKELMPNGGPYMMDRFKIKLKTIDEVCGQPEGSFVDFIKKDK